MSVNYSLQLIQARLTQVVTDISSTAYLVITDSSSNELVRLLLSSAVGTISSAILTFSGLPLTATASATGTAALANILGGSSQVVYGLTVGTTSSNNDIQLTPTSISSGQTINLTAATITSPL